MVHGKKEQLLKVDDIERWLENYFLDPLTSYLDEAAFRIDLFETAEEYIIEALLPAYRLQDIEIILETNNISIRVSKGSSEHNRKQRNIPFPFPVIEHEVTAAFHDEVLEVFIAKNKLCAGIIRKVLIVQ
ncbi:Hsp20/alpha crystallin family protein [Bacillus benzoevorans]|uniref:HSP20 family molecular chaperone IbpA n=1 Tax=Bacillus benzoevorans TaxID=1456 RepID=A0A7X0HV35_9BACI|nr:Hsp20/alpha crystallin family protein [Bacillus benzoevorans]MBB6447384.1 HSP20 family molecular chaperone IbpA [Bacillus benzoevorans]